MSEREIVPRLKESPTISSCLSLCNTGSRVRMARAPSLHHTKFAVSAPKYLQLPPNLKEATTLTYLHNGPLQPTTALCTQPAHPTARTLTSPSPPHYPLQALAASLCLFSSSLAASSSLSPSTSKLSIYLAADILYRIFLGASLPAYVLQMYVASISKICT